jgi:hypothetical protein
MSLLVAARVLPAVLMLPIGGWGARLAIGGVLAWALSAWLPVSPDAGGLIGEIVIGAGLGLVVGLPVHAARGLGGEALHALGGLGAVWAWAIFFAMGGPALWLTGLAAGFRGVSPGVPLEATLEAGGLLFYGVLVLGLPVWLTHLLAVPVAGVVERLSGRPIGGGLVAASRVPVVVGMTLLLLPWLADELRGLWLAVLRVPT